LIILYLRSDDNQFAGTTYNDDRIMADFRDAAELAKSKYSARLIILYLRSDDNQFAGTTYNDDRIMADLKKSGAIVVDATLANKGEADVTIPGDGHPTAKGHRLRAEMLWDTIQQGELMSGEPP
jgi:hypothetical protein